MSTPPSLERVTVIIPALNEEAALPNVLRDLPAVGQVIVVDNGSTDRTPDVARGMGASVVLEPQRGYGAACLRGLAVVEQQIVGGRAAPAVIAFVDGDYSDFPQYLTELVSPILAEEADFVLGSRILGNRERGAMPFQSVFGNHLASFLMHRLWGANYTDLGPFRAIRYASLQALQMSDRNFGWTVEMQIKAVRAGLRVREVPVPYRCRIGQSKISGTLIGTIRAGWKILYVIGKHGLQRSPIPTDSRTAE